MENPKIRKCVLGKDFNSRAGNILCQIFVFPFYCLSDVVSSLSISCWAEEYKPM